MQVWPLERPVGRTVRESQTHGVSHEYQPSLASALFPPLAAALDAGLATSERRLASQTVVGSEAPRDPDLVLANEPLMRIGLIDGPLEYLFGNVTGAMRLEDGSIVVTDEQSYEVRRYDGNGRHLWTSGRQGEGPGEYGGLWLLRGCPGAAITVFDWHLDRITELDLDGRVTDTRALNVVGVNPYGAPACSPDGDPVFTPWPDDTQTEGVAVGEHYRWQMDLKWARNDGLVTLRSGIPGTERTFYGGTDGPRNWGRTMVFAVVSTGVWYGAADDYELEHVDWTGRVTRIARWNGPDLEVTREHLNRYRDAYLARYDDAESRRRFERESWPGIRDGLPERFLAYDALLPLADGSVWVKSHDWRATDTELHLLDAEGAWCRRLTIPGGSTLLDAGRDWVLLRQTGELGEQTVAVYQFVESGSS